MKKIKLLVIAAIVLAAGVFFLTNENLVKADVTEETVIKDGVYIGGIDVSGMTAEEATKAVDAYVGGLQDQWITLVGPKDSLRYQLKDLGLSAQTKAAVQEAVGIGNAGSLIKRYKALQDLEKENYVVDMGLAIDKQLTANNIYNKRSKIDIKSIDNGLKKEGNKFVYVEGQAGNEVDIVAAVNELNEYIATEWVEAPVENAEFTLTSIVSQPRGTEEELAVVKDLIGSFSTWYKNTSWERNKNVENGAAKINGTILYPGDEFSVYEQVSPFTKENGYEYGFAYSNGETIKSIGGGICQVSTTMYQAALHAELEIKQRANHSMTVSYVDLGGDAAIAGTYKDLKFINNYDFPIYIEGTCNGEWITFNIYGVETRDKNRKVKFEPETISENDPITEFSFSEELPIGKTEELRIEHKGYVIKYWKIVTVNGVQTEKTLVNKSTYRASCRQLKIGIKGATAEQLAEIQDAIKVAIETKEDTELDALIASYASPTTATPDSGTSTPETGNTSQDNPAEQKPAHTCDSKTWKSDENNHWKECSTCGKTINKGVHKYSDDTDATCNTCDHEREVEEETPIDPVEPETPEDNTDNEDQTPESGDGSN